MASPSTTANSLVQSPVNLAKALPRLTPRRRRPDHRQQQDQAVVIPNVLPLPAPKLNIATGSSSSSISNSSSASDDNDDNASITKHIFIRPTRRILSPRDHQLFLASSTYNLLVSFVFGLTDAVRDRTISSSSPSRPSTSPSRLENKNKNKNDDDDDDDDDDEDAHEIIIDKILHILDEVESLVRQHPAQDQQGSRFGNLAFRPFFDHLRSCLPRLHGLHLGPLIKIPRTDADTNTDPGDDEVVLDAIVDELSTYLLHSFGNPLRIDYGSGHELNFIVWLLCLYQLSLLPTTTFPAVILCVFTRYLKLMRLIQSTYYLEPAGSHGVWGLDDYQFLPFLFGASQLLHHHYIRPLSIHNPLILEQFAPEYLYLDQVAFVNRVKTVESLRWHSPLLDDISAAKSWSKVEGGLKRMFVADVLGKLPVMQHFLFGSLVPATTDMTPSELVTIDDASETKDHPAHHGHSSSASASSWGDCCGIKVPSSIAATEEMKKRMGNTSKLRRIPFD